MTNFSSPIKGASKAREATKDKPRVMERAAKNCSVCKGQYEKITFYLKSSKIFNR